MHASDIYQYLIHQKFLYYLSEVTVRDNTGITGQCVYTLHTGTQ